MEAQLMITGYVGGPVDFWNTRTNGTFRASFRMACTPRVRRQSGEWGDLPTTWMTVVCWRSLAEHVASSFGKGDPVLVAGRLRTEEWTDDQGGQHSRMVIEATSAGHDLNRGTTTFRRVQRGDAAARSTEPEIGTATERSATDDTAPTERSATDETASGDEPDSGEEPSTDRPPVAVV